MDGSPALRGTVSSIARGITDQDNPNGPQLLSSGNPTFTWVRLAQRIPVTVRITRVPPGVLVTAGMTCTVVMKEGAAPQLGLGIRKVMAAIFGAPSG
jgi:multidrug resistance efflux pump